MTIPFGRRPGATAALLATVAFLSLAGGAAAQDGGGGAARSEAGGEEAESASPGIDLPLVGRISLPDFMAGWFGGEGEGEEAAGGEGEAPAEPPAVIVQRVETRSVGESFDFIGTIQPIEQVAVRARVEGYIRDVAFTGGQKVQAGDLLFQIEPEQYEAAVRAAEAQLSGAQATLNQAERDFSRQSDLAQSGVTARATLDTATAARENAQAQLLQAQAALTQAQLDLGYTRITAAIDGEMSVPLITRGNYVSATSGELATLTQMNPIWGVFPIGENQLTTWQRVGIEEAGSAADVAGSNSAAPETGGETAQGDAAPNDAPSGGGSAGGEETQVADAGGGTGAPEEETPIPSAEGTGAAGAPPPPPGSEVNAQARADTSQIGEDFVLQLRLPNGAPYEPAGRFDFVSNTVSSTTGTVEARISFPNPGDFLLANQNVTLVANERNPPTLPVVPQSAIQLSRDGRFVLLVRPDDTVERRRIEVGQQLGNMTAVRSGLAGGEIVVIRGSANVGEGTRVQPRTEEEARAMEGAAPPAAASQGGGGGNGGAPGGASGGAAR